MGKKIAVKNWERIRLGSGNEVLLEAYNKGTSSWDSSIRSLLEHNGMLGLYFWQFNFEHKIRQNLRYFNQDPYFLNWTY